MTEKGKSTATHSNTAQGAEKSGTKRPMPDLEKFDVENIAANLFGSQSKAPKKKRRKRSTSNSNKNEGQKIIKQEKGVKQSRKKVSYRDVGMDNNPNEFEQEFWLLRLTERTLQRGGKMFIMWGYLENEGDMMKMLTSGKGAFQTIKNMELTEGKCYLVRGGKLNLRDKRGKAISVSETSAFIVMNQNRKMKLNALRSSKDYKEVNGFCLSNMVESQIIAVKIKLHFFSKMRKSQFWAIKCFDHDGNYITIHNWVAKDEVQGAKKGDWIYLSSIERSKIGSEQKFRLNSTGPVMSLPLLQEEEKNIKMPTPESIDYSLLSKDAEFDRAKQIDISTMLEKCRNPSNAFAASDSLYVLKDVQIQEFKNFFKIQNEKKEAFEQGVDPSTIISKQTGKERALQDTDLVEYAWSMLIRDTKGQSMKIVAWDDAAYGMLNIPARKLVLMPMEKMFALKNKLQEVVLDILLRYYCKPRSNNARNYNSQNFSGWEAVYFRENQDEDEDDEDDFHYDEDDDITKQ